jgi:hypothetical protein
MIAMADDDRRQVPCPSCGYDLRGVPAVGDFYRCPECGGLTTLAQMTETRQRRSGARARIVVGVLIALCMIALRLLHWYGAYSVRRTAEAVATLLAIALSIALVILVARWQHR